MHRATDQAAGLRRRQARRPARCIDLVSSSPDAAPRLAQAFFRHGWTSLLIDTQGRLFADSPCSLFDWRQQLARRQLHTVAQPWGAGWTARGAQADDPAFAALAADYDCLLFDVRPDAPAWQTAPQAGRTLLLDAEPATLKQAYALLKTLAHHGCRADIVLLGEAAACAQLQAACRQFLDPAFAQALGLLQESDAFAALAVRMVNEETGRSAVA